MRTVAALYIDPRGPYPRMQDVECWDEKRDARLYAGPHPVVAHPPCGRWCRLAGLVESRWGYRKGDDGGTFLAALEAVRKWGGVLEHPAYTDAWPEYALPQPTGTGWQRTLAGEWVCMLSQCAYGHRARKRTWLLYVGKTPPAVPDWTEPATDAVISGAANHCSVEGRVWSGEARKTPPAFAAFLVALARCAVPVVTPEVRPLASCCIR